MYRYHLRRDFYQHSTADQGAGYLQTRGLKDNSDRQKQQSVEGEKLKDFFIVGTFRTSLLSTFVGPKVTVQLK